MSLLEFFYTSVNSQGNSFSQTRSWCQNTITIITTLGRADQFIGWVGNNDANSTLWAYGVASEVVHSFGITVEVKTSIFSANHVAQTNNSTTGSDLKMHIMEDWTRIQNESKQKYLVESIMECSKSLTNMADTVSFVIETYSFLWYQHTLLFQWKIGHMDT